MLKNNLPFAVFLATLIALMALIDGGLVLLKKQDDRNADRMLTLLAQGKISEANNTLCSIAFFEKVDFHQSPFSGKFFQNLATCLGEPEIAIKDTLDLKQYLSRIEAWPQPLKTYTKLKFWQAFIIRLPTKEQYQAMNHFREVMRWDREDKNALRSWFPKLGFFSGINALEPVLVGTPAVVCCVQFFLIGPLLLSFLLLEWGVERRRLPGEEPFSAFTLSPRQNYLTLGIYSLALTLSFFPAFYAYHGQPFTSAFTTTLYLITLLISIAVILPLTILVTLKLNIAKMGKENEIADKPRGEIVLLSWIKQYKFFLWRLWPVWLANSLVAGLLIRLYWGYPIDLFGLYWMVKPW